MDRRSAELVELLALVSLAIELPGEVYKSQRLHKILWRHPFSWLVDPC